MAGIRRTFDGVPVQLQRRAHVRAAIWRREAGRMHPGQISHRLHIPTRSRLLIQLLRCGAVGSPRNPEPAGTPQLRSMHSNIIVQSVKTPYLSSCPHGCQWVAQH